MPRGASGEGASDVLVGVGWTAVCGFGRGHPCVNSGAGAPAPG